MEPDPPGSHSGAEAPGDAARHKADGTLSIVAGTESPGDISPYLTARRGRPRRRNPNVEEHVKGILSGDRVVLGRAITLIESRRPEDNHSALAMLERLLPDTGRSVRIGITGVPGVGKSTFIEALGTYLTGKGHKLAVLAVDPSSSISRGSIMGDKTRMQSLAGDPSAFIRPSPSAGSLGGVARKTREAMLVCEAAGFDVIFVETVGVGQSETVVSSMVDFFLLLMLAGAGDHLQGIKRGIMELADAVVINKADGDNRDKARRTRVEFEQAVHLLRSTAPGWRTPLLTCSSLSKEGIPDVWDAITRYCREMSANGYFEKNRREQARTWMLDTIREALFERFSAHPKIAPALSEFEQRVTNGEIPAVTAAQRLLDLYAGRHTEK